MQRHIGQVIAPLLVIRRVANKDTLIRNTVASAHLSLLKNGSQGESTGVSDILPGKNLAISADQGGVISSGFGVGATSDFRREKV